MSPVRQTITESVYDQPFAGTLAYTHVSLPWVSQYMDVVSGTNVIQVCQRRERKLNNNGWMGSIGGSAATVIAVFLPHSFLKSSVSLFSLFRRF